MDLHPVRRPPDPAALVRAYRDAWNEPDHRERVALLRDIWAEGARFVDPMADVAGPAALADHIDRVRTKVPGLRLELATAPRRSRDWVQFDWVLHRDRRPPLRGSDAAEVRDGRIQVLASFWEGRS